MRRVEVLLLIGIVVLAVVYLVAKQQSPVGSYEGEQSSWFDRLLGDDGPADFGSGEGGSGYYFSSFFEGVEFRFKVKNYRAMSDDDLSDADGGL